LKSHYIDELQGNDTMEASDVKDRFRRVITNITNLPAEKIGETTSFRKELAIDSLSLLEIGVDVDYEFRLGLPEQRFQGIDTLAQTVELVEQELALRQRSAAAG
jgi:acyl carrier protein